MTLELKLPCGCKSDARTMGTMVRDGRVGHGHYAHDGSFLGGCVKANPIDSLPLVLRSHVEMLQGMRVALVSDTAENMNRLLQWECTRVSDAILALAARAETAERRELEALRERDALKAELVQSSNAQAKVQRLTVELAEARQAIGLATTCVPSMEIDTRIPVGMMQRVCAEFRALTAENERLRCQVMELHPQSRDELRVLRQVMRRLGWTETCAKCKGRGLGAYLADASGLDQHCPTCSGTGRVLRSYTLDEVMPALEAALLRVFQGAWRAGFGVVRVSHEGDESTKGLIDRALAGGTK